MILQSQARTRPSLFALKMTMAITGVIFVGFVFIHMFGNLKVYQGAQAYNGYAQWLREIGYPLIPKTGVLWVLRVVLLICLIAHVTSALMIYARSRAARGKFKRRRLMTMGKNAWLMLPTGIILAVFIVVHLLDLTIGKILAPESFVAGDAYANLVASLSRPTMATFYLLTMLLVCLHIFHGTVTTLQDFGVTGKRARLVWQLIGQLIAIAILLGNAAIPVLVQVGVIA